MGRHLSPRYGQVILVSRRPVWHLSVDHNIDVQYVCNISFPMLPNELESVKLNIGFPVVRTNGRCTVTWSPNFLGWVDLLTHGAPLIIIIILLLLLLLLIIIIIIICILFVPKKKTPKHVYNLLVLQIAVGHQCKNWIAYSMEITWAFFTHKLLNWRFENKKRSEVTDTKTHVILFLLPFWVMLYI